MSLYLQQQRGLSSLGTGVVFLPMMLIGPVFTSVSARIAERLGARLAGRRGAGRDDGRGWLRSPPRPRRHQSSPLAARRSGLSAQSRSCGQADSEPR
jgi:hypothetical protein